MYVIVVLVGQEGHLGNFTKNLSTHVCFETRKKKYMYVCMYVINGLTDRRRREVEMLIRAWRNPKNNHGCALITLPPPPSPSLSPRCLAFSSASAPASDGDGGGGGGLFSSLVGRIKGVFKSPASDSPQNVSPSSQQKQQQKIPDFTLMAFANELKKARRIESFTKLVKTQPAVSQTSAIGKIDKFEVILEALSKHDPMGQNLEAKHKAEVAEKCGCSIQDINDVLAKYEWMKTAHAKLQQMHAKGEGIPKTLDDMKKLLVDTSPRKYNTIQHPVKNEVARNASCPCGSGKKYKRCCGRGSS